MSKRSRPVKKIIALDVPPLAEDQWRIIASHIKWYDVQTLLNFIAVSQSAIRFVQPLIRQLVGKLLQPVDETEKALYELITEVFHSNEKVPTLFVKVLHAYYYTLRDTPLQIWRIWASTLLSILRFAELHVHYCMKENKCLDKHKKAKYGFIKYENRIKRSVGPSTRLDYIYYQPKDNIEAIPLYLLDVVNVVDGMPLTGDPTELCRLAEEAVKKEHNEAEQVIFMAMLKQEKLTPSQRRACCYYALSSSLTIRKAGPKDTYKDVVIARSNDVYIHIYSEHNDYVDKLVSQLFTYNGKQVDAPLALRLDSRRQHDEKKCAYRCKELLSSVFIY